MKNLIKPNLNQFCKDALTALVEILPFMLLILIGVMLISGHAFADGGTDYLKPGVNDVKTTFGQGSALMYFIYIAEAIVVAFSWVKTKSPWVLVSLPVLLVATHIFFGSITPPA